MRSPLIWLLFAAVATGGGGFRLGHSLPTDAILDELITKATAEAAAAEATSAYNYYRLPHSVAPDAYDLKIITHLEDPENLRFEGVVAIRLFVLEDTHNITLHALNLTIDQSKIQLDHVPKTKTAGADEAATPKNCVRSTAVNAVHDYLVLHLCAPLHRGEQHLLTIPFGAPLNKHLHGYYRSSYHDKASNQTRWLAVTQFEPAAARVAFPCFDEPAYKAKFTVALGHHRQYTALSNMPLKQKVPLEGTADWEWSEFEESVPMSTYLVAYTVNDFAFVGGQQTNLSSDVVFRTWARRDAIDQCDYAGVVGPQVLKYYEDIFDVKFPLPKIDQIALPDFNAGAMENWGLVTYRETALLYADKVSSQSNKQRVASVIAHELAHQWFGNLVTMKWWTDLWLNEGFATYVASLGIEHIRPEWRSFVEESVDNTLAIFRLDALKSSHPISQPIQHTNEIAQIFDSISYKKGSAVLRMMHLFLGDEAFRAGIHAYLKRYAYSNAEQDNLWGALTEAALKYRSIPSDFDIKHIMDSWTLQTGYPVVSVQRDYEQGTALVSQERYLLDGEAQRSAQNTCWWVPLSYATQNAANFTATSPKEWLMCDAKSREMVAKTLTNMPGPDEWIIMNVQMAGLYKVKYDARNWDLLIGTLMSEHFHKIHIVNRAQLIDDALSLAWSRDQDYDVAMRLIEYLKREREYIPWKAALDSLAGVNRIMRQTPEYEFFKKYMHKILTPIYVHLHGLNMTAADERSHSTILHKVLVASWACRFEVGDCIPRARQYFTEWTAVSDPDAENPIPTDLRSVVYCTAMRHGNDDDWHFLWQRYKASNVAAEKKTIITSLGCTREIWLLQRYLEWAFDGTSHIRKQDSIYAFSSVARGEIGFHLAKDYYLSNIEFLHDFYQPDTTDLAHLLSPLASQMTTRRDYENMKAFTDQHARLLTKAQLGVQRALEMIQLNAQWKERNYNDISRRIESRLIADLLKE